MVGPRTAVTSCGSAGIGLEVAPGPDPARLFFRRSFAPRLGELGIGVTVNALRFPFSLYCIPYPIMYNMVCMYDRNKAV